MAGMPRIAENEGEIGMAVCPGCNDPLEVSLDCCNVPSLLECLNPSCYWQAYRWGMEWGNPYDKEQLAWWTELDRRHSLLVGSMPEYPVKEGSYLASN